MKKSAISARGMVSVLTVGLFSGFGALRSRRYLDDDIIANGGVPDDAMMDQEPLDDPSSKQRAPTP